MVTYLTVSKHTGKSVKKINNMKKIIELVKKFLFGTKVQKAVAAAQVVKEVKKTSVKIKTGGVSKKK
jgi:hypothetical protein